MNFLSVFSIENDIYKETEYAANNFGRGGGALDRCGQGDN